MHTTQRHTKISWALTYSAIALLLLATCSAWLPLFFAIRTADADYSVAIAALIAGAIALLIGAGFAHLAIRLDPAAGIIDLRTTCLLAAAADLLTAALAATLS